MDNAPLKSADDSSSLETNTAEVSAEPQQAWSSPKLTDLGSIVDETRGISYTTGDGLTNLTP